MERKTKRSCESIGGCRGNVTNREMEREKKKLWMERRTEGNKVWVGRGTYGNVKDG